MGLHSVAFSPNYVRNHLFYVAYNGRDWNTRVVEYRANAAGTGIVAGSARQLLVVQQPRNEHHKGGQLAFGPDGMLYLGLGDGECCDDPAARAQNMDLLLGKLLRLDVTSRSPKPQIVALGLRNPWRFSFDRATGDLYIADVGAGLWEEVDYQPRAQLGQLVNYGWDAWEAKAVKEAKDPNPAGTLTFPVYAYPHDQNRCSIRLRLPRHDPRRSGGTLLLRRLLHGRGLEPAHGRRRRDRGAPRVGHDPRPFDLRRGRARRALRRLCRHRPRVQAHALARPSAPAMYVGFGEKWRFSVE